MTFLTYEGKVAVALLVFYLFYRFLLKKETFHRFNRIVLMGTAVLSFVLPLCVITIHKPMEMAPAGFEVLPGTGGATGAVPTPVTEALETVSGPWWPTALTILFFTGVAFMLFRLATSILCILRIIRQGECVGEEDGCQIIVTERDVAPFSWMRYIVLPREDWEGPHAPIIAHEKAHIGYRHSADLLLVDILTAFQWFNPASWMLRADLQELHEYEADDAVLRGGANIKEYQYLLIRKAVSKSGYSVANSFNHSILKNRITMMSKSKSPLARGLRALYLLPLVCLGLSLQAQTVFVPSDKDKEKNNSDEKIVDLYVKADGSVYASPDVVVTDVVDYLKSKGLTGPEGPTIRINAAKNVDICHIDALKRNLREANALKVNYAKPAALWAKPESGVKRRLAPARDFNGNELKTPSAVLAELSEEERENVIVVRINSADKVFFGNKVLSDDRKMIDLGKGFVRAHGMRTMFSLGYDKVTSYGAYQHIQEIIYRIYNELREEKAKELYGKSLSELDKTELDTVYKAYPINVVEVTD